MAEVLRKHRTTPIGQTAAHTRTSTARLCPMNSLDDMFENQIRLLINHQISRLCNRDHGYVFVAVFQL